jgi:hypothetical protein
MSWEYTDTACMLSGMHAYAKHATDIEIQNKICRKFEIKKLFNLKIKSVYKSRDHRIAFYSSLDMFWSQDRRVSDGMFNTRSKMSGFLNLNLKSSKSKIFSEPNAVGASCPGTKCQETNCSGPCPAIKIFLFPISDVEDSMEKYKDYAIALGPGFPMPVWREGPLLYQLS